MARIRSGTKTITPTRVFFPSPRSVGTTSTAATITNAGDLASMLCKISQTGTVTGGTFGTGTVTTGCTLSYTIETVSGGAPTGTLYHANATGTVVVANGDDSVLKTVAFIGNVPVTQGDTVALCLRISSGTPSVLQIRTFSPIFASSDPLLYKIDTGVAGTSSVTPCMSLTYTTGEVVIPGSACFGTASNLSISTTTTPDEIGHKILMPFSGRSDGFVFRCNSGVTSQAGSINLYNSSNTVIATCLLDPNLLVLSGNNHLLWSTPVDLVAGQTYRLIVTPSTSTTWTNTMLSIRTFSGHSSNITTYVTDTQRTDGGAWTDTANRYYPFILSFDRIYTPTRGTG